MLSIRQQPERAKMCGTKERDRRPIDPPPIVQIKLSDPSADKHKDYLQSPYLFMCCNLVTVKDPSGDIVAPAHRALAGTVVSSLHRLKDVDNSDGGFFVFGDMSVRIEGRFRLRFTLFELVEGQVVQIMSTVSDPMTVFPGKSFPGMAESTFLSRSFSDQGVRIRTRKDHHVKPKQLQSTDASETSPRSSAMHSPPSSCYEAELSDADGAPSHKHSNHSSATAPTPSPEFLAPAHYSPPSSPHAFTAPETMSSKPPQPAPSDHCVAPHHHAMSGHCCHHSARWSSYSEGCHAEPNISGDHYHPHASYPGGSGAHRTYRERMRSHDLSHTYPAPSACSHPYHRLTAPQSHAAMPAPVSVRHQTPPHAHSFMLPPKPREPVSCPGTFASAPSPYDQYMDYTPTPPTRPPPYYHRHHSRQHSRTPSSSSQYSDGHVSPPRPLSPSESQTPMPGPDPRASSRRISGREGMIQLPPLHTLSTSSPPINSYPTVGSTPPYRTADQEPEYVGPSPLAKLRDAEPIQHRNPYAFKARTQRKEHDHPPAMVQLKYNGYKEPPATPAPTAAKKIKSPLKPAISSLRKDDVLRALESDHPTVCLSIGSLQGKINEGLTDTPSLRSEVLNCIRAAVKHAWVVKYRCQKLIGMYIESIFSSGKDIQPLDRRLLDTICARIPTKTAKDKKDAVEINDKKEQRAARDVLLFIDRLKELELIEAKSVSQLLSDLKYTPPELVLSIAAQ
ncbi:hypothetical protein BGW38_003944, partial [Lunasporangiospora selenospora]